MSDLLQAIAAYVPPGIIRATLDEPSPSPPTDAKFEPMQAAVLFADVSGFTPLTEALAQKGREGPEELTRLLNNYFSRMIALIEAEGGEVVKFSGDAVTVVFPAEAERNGLGEVTRRALQSAEAMQGAMAEFAMMETSVGPVALGMKIGIGAGEILSVWVGGWNERWEYVIAGDPLRQVAQAEHQARRGQIILSPEARAIIAPQRIKPCPLIPPDWGQVQNPKAVEAALRVYVPSVVAGWLEEKLQEWLAVLRPMSVLFTSVGGIDYAQTDAVETLHTFFRAAQKIIYGYEGSINKLAVDDKGTIFIVLFGAPPHAHEDDPERALRSAIDLQALAEEQGLSLAIGTTTGRVFTGPVGSEARREYTVMGDTVNLAARLMSAAGKGQIRCDYETYRLARNRLAFDTLPPIRVKGKAGLIRIYRPTGEAGVKKGTETDGDLIGRRAELARLTARLNEVQAGQSRIILIEGEAGIGKSRLAEELIYLIREQGLTGLLGMGRSVEQRTPYRAWRDIFTSYFDLDEVDDLTERQSRVIIHVQDTAPELLERLPLLNDVLNLGFPENALTASLDTQLRHESLISLFLALLRAWATERPLVIILEDAHWLDTLSWDLTLQVARALTVARVPLLLVVVMRPLEEKTPRIEPAALSKLDKTERMVITSLSPDETVALAAARLGLSDEGLPEPVAELVKDRTGGNPFFAEELIYTLRDEALITVETVDGRTRCLVSGDLTQATQTLPDTIQGIVLSRIDRLPPEEQLTLKVAAVIGRTFAYPTLFDTLGSHMELSDRLLKNYLIHLAHLNLTPLEAPEPELTYIFKHIITQEVAYETLLFAQRRQLHRTVARWYEQKFGGGDEPVEAAAETPLATYLPLLVYHWRQAEDKERERHYARLAGKWAAAQFANVEAAAYFSRALELTPDTDLPARYDLLLDREAVNDLRGERELQKQDLTALVAVIEQIGDPRQEVTVALRQANFAEATSDYPAALIAAQRAVELAREVGYLVGGAEGYITCGKVLWRQGKYDEARMELAHTLPLAQAIDNRRAEATSLYYLGHVSLYQGNYPVAQDHYQQALRIYRADGYRLGEADSLSNLGVIHYELGDYPKALDHYEQTLSIFQSIGDRRGETMMLNNLGTVYCDLGDYEASGEYHRKALDIRLAIGDRWGEANSLVNLGLIYHSLNDDETARQYCERALTIQQEVGDRRGEGYSLTYLGHALTDLDKLETAAEAYDKAIRLRRELGQHSLIIDDLAGLACVSMAQGNLEEALGHVEAALTWIEANGVEGIEYPLQVCLTSYRVLQATANGDMVALERARAILIRAYQTLQGQAAAIGDDALRQKFLQNVKVNREITAAWEE